MNTLTTKQIEEILQKAFLKAIKEVGIETVKKMSWFGSNTKK